MFYDAERIVRKNEDYEITKAYAAVNDFESNGFSHKEALSMIDVLLKDDLTESRASILGKARILLLNRMRSAREESTANQPNTNICCPVMGDNNENPLSDS